MMMNKNNNEKSTMEKEVTPERNVATVGYFMETVGSPSPHEESKDKHDNDDIRHTPFALNKNDNDSHRHDKEKEINPGRNVDIAVHANERGVEDAIKAMAPLVIQSNTRNVPEIPPETVITTDKDTKEMVQRTYWMLVITIIVAVCLLTTQMGKNG